MADYLLLGAGFSRNWGGWLATEAFEYLLGCPEVVGDPSIATLLWKHQSGGGFESALAEAYNNFTRDPAPNLPVLRGLQDAISRMFADMNNAFMEVSDWEFQAFKGRMVGTFLSRFDAIFTLNQDVLLEHYYVGNVHLSDNGKWRAGAQLPGMTRTPPQDPAHHDSWARSTWRPAPEADFSVQANAQPIFKLHGSSNWLYPDGRSMLIMGGDKVKDIGQTPILSKYAQIFEEGLSAPSARLMVIGYGFRDAHINATITAAVEKGLKLFIICPEGAAIAMQLNPTRASNKMTVGTPLEDAVQKALIGASRRGLREIFGGDTAEHNKVMRFFS